MVYVDFTHTLLGYAVDLKQTMRRMFSTSAGGDGDISSSDPQWLVVIVPVFVMCRTKQAEHRLFMGGIGEGHLWHCSTSFWSGDLSTVSCWHCCLASFNREQSVSRTLYSNESTPPVRSFSILVAHMRNFSLQKNHRWSIWFYFIFIQAMSGLFS